MIRSPDYTDFQRVPVGLDEISLKGYQFSKGDGLLQDLETPLDRFGRRYCVKDITIKF